MDAGNLKDSLLWKDNVRAAQECPGIIASVMEAMAGKFLIEGNGMQWRADGTLSEEGPRLPRRAYVPQRPDDDPALHPLYDAIPAVDDAKFLKGLSTDPYKHEPDGRAMSRDYYMITRGSPLAAMPADADVHHIAGAAILLKHYLMHPQRLICPPGYDRETQLAVARRCLNACFEIAEARGIESGFVLSCAAFGAAMDEITAITPEHARDSGEHYETALAHKREFDKILNGRGGGSDSERAARLARVIEELKKIIPRP